MGRRYIDSTSVKSQRKKKGETSVEGMYFLCSSVHSGFRLHPKLGSTHLCTTIYMKDVRGRCVNNGAISTLLTAADICCFRFLFLCRQDVDIIMVFAPPIFPGNDVCIESISPLRVLVRESGRIITALQTIRIDNVGTSLSLYRDWERTRS